MNENLENILKTRNHKVNTFLPIGKRFDGTDLALPVMVAVGKEAGPTLVIDGCHHGDEHEGSLAIIQLMQSIKTEELRGTVIAVPIVNVTAFEHAERLTPLVYWGGDQNRNYPGKKEGEGSINERIAYEYGQNVVSKADYVISMHGGGNKLTISRLTVICQPTGKKEVDEKSNTIARAFGPELLWGGTSFVGTLHDVTDALDIPIIVAELGGHALRDASFQNYIDTAYNGIRNVMRSIKMLNEEVLIHEDPILIEPPLYMTSVNGGFYRVKKMSGETVQQGEIIGTVMDMFGVITEEVIAPFDGIVCAHWSYPMVVPGNWTAILGKVKE